MPAAMQLRSPAGSGALLQLAVEHSALPERMQRHCCAGAGWQWQETRSRGTCLQLCYASTQVGAYAHVSAALYTTGVSSNQPFTGGEHEVVYGHRDFEYTLPGQLRASFLWTPYLSNATALLSNW